jgi:ABC-2 type transport system ATP-binding protein
MFWSWIYELAGAGTTILVTTHYMDEAERCQRLAFLSRGHLIALGTVAEVTRAFDQPTIEDVFIELQRRDEGEASVSRARSKGAARPIPDSRFPVP